MGGRGLPVRLFRWSFPSVCRFWIDLRRAHLGSPARLFLFWCHLTNLFRLFFKHKSHVWFDYAILGSVQYFVIVKRAGQLILLLLLFLPITVRDSLLARDLAHLREQGHLHSLLQIVHHRRFQHDIEVGFGVDRSSKLVVHRVLVSWRLVQVERGVRRQRAVAGFSLLSATLRLPLAIDDSNVARHWIDWAYRRIREGVLRIISVYFLALVW